MAGDKTKEKVKMTKKIKDSGPTARLISPEAVAKALGAEEITDPKVIAGLKLIRKAALGPAGGGHELGCDDIAVMIADKLLGNNAPLHLRRPQAEELSGLTREQLLELMNIKKFPLPAKVRRKIVASIGETIVSRMEKRWQLAESVASAEREGRYEATEHATGILLRNMLNEAVQQGIYKGMGEILDLVYEKVRRKLRHTDFKIRSWYPAGYQGYEKPEDVTDITVDTKTKRATLECKDGHSIEFGFDPKGRYNEWARSARIATPEEMEFVARHQAIRDKLVQAHRAGEITDKDFDAALQKDLKICEKELRRRWKELQRK